MNELLGRCFHRGLENRHLVGQEVTGGCTVTAVWAVQITRFTAAGGHLQLE
jgi:hypothetical protein